MQSYVVWKNLNRPTKSGFAQCKIQDSVADPSSFVCNKELVKQKPHIVASGLLLYIPVICVALARRVTERVSCILHAKVMQLKPFISGSWRCPVLRYLVHKQEQREDECNNIPTKWHISNFVKKKKTKTDVVLLVAHDEKWFHCPRAPLATFGFFNSWAAIWHLLL